jgi:hypothetical protein
MSSDLKEEIIKLVKEELGRAQSEKVKYGQVLSEGLRFHLDNKVSFYNNIYRPDTEKFYALYSEAKELFSKGKLNLVKEEAELFEGHLGEWGVYEGKEVPLEVPMVDPEEDDRELDEAEYQGKDVELNKPKRGGSKKFYVYVKCGDNIKKISFGSPGMPLRVSEPDRRASFKARHNCEKKNDKCTAGYWSCRIGRYPSITGASKSYRWW